MKYKNFSTDYLYIAQYMFMAYTADHDQYVQDSQWTLFILV